MIKDDSVMRIPTGKEKIVLRNVGILLEECWDQTDSVLAQELGVHASAISRWQRQGVGSIKANNLDKLRDFFKATDELLLNPDQNEVRRMCCELAQAQHSRSKKFSNLSFCDVLEATSPAKSKYEGYFCCYRFSFTKENHFVKHLLHISNTNNGPVFELRGPSYTGENNKHRFTGSVHEGVGHFVCLGYDAKLEEFISLFISSVHDPNPRSLEVHDLVGIWCSPGGGVHKQPCAAKIVLRYRPDLKDLKFDAAMKQLEFHDKSNLTAPITMSSNQTDHEYFKQKAYQYLLNPRISGKTPPSVEDIKTEQHILRAK